MIWLPSIALAAAIPFVGYGLLRAVTSWLERRRHARPGARRVPAGGMGPRVVGMALLVVLSLLVWVTVAGRMMSTVALIVSLVGIGAAWALHGAPGHTRGLKYSLFLSCSILFRTTLGADRAIVDMLGIEWTALLLAPPVVAVLVATGWILVVLRPDEVPRSVSEHVLTQRWYWRVTSLQGPDAGSFLRYLPLMLLELGPAFLLVRYAVKGKLLSQPFLYLRSFSQADAPRVFAEVVGPGLARRGPFAGLVHTTQPNSRLSRDVPLLWRGDFTTSSDADWQLWVHDALSRAKAVVLDVTGAPGGGDGLAWEIELCRQHVPPERLLVLSQSGASPFDSDVTFVPVDLQAPDEAREAVARFGARVNASLGVLDPAPGRWTPRRRALSPLTLAGVLAGILVFLTVTSITAFERYMARQQDVLQELSADPAPADR